MKSLKNAVPWIAKGILIATVLGFVLAASVPRMSIRFGLLQGDTDGNQQCITNLACISAGTGTFNNLNATNLTVYQNLTVTTINNNPVSAFGGGTCDVLSVLDMGSDLVVQAQTNTYYINWGHTNSVGQTNIYASLQATNDVQILHPTNGIRGSLMSFNVVAWGGDRVVFLDTNWPHFDTNGGFVLAGSKYVMYLTNHNELRVTIQSNVVDSLLWAVFGQ